MISKVVISDRRRTKDTALTMTSKVPNLKDLIPDTCLDTALLDDQIPKLNDLTRILFPDALEALFFAAQAALPNIVASPSDGAL